MNPVSAALLQKLRRNFVATLPQDIPYTIAAEKYKAEEFVGSAEATLQVKESEKVYSDVKGGGKQIPRVHLNGVDVSDGITVASGIYEEVGTPLMNKVAFLTRKMALLGPMGSMTSVHSASGSAVSRLSQKSNRKSMTSLYDKISRNFSFFESSSIHSLGNNKPNKNKRQRSVSDVISPKLEDLSSDKTSEDAVSDAGLDWNSISQLIEKRRLSTIDENLNSPNVTLASHKVIEEKQHVKFLFKESDEDIYSRKRSQAELSKSPKSQEEVVDSSKFTKPIFV